MSLYRTYRLKCDGPTLARQLGSAVAVRWLTEDHQDFSSGADTAAKARRYAYKAGWLRHSRELPLGDTGVTTVRPFDLCPSCAGTLVAK